MIALQDLGKNWIKMWMYLLPVVKFINIFGEYTDFPKIKTLKKKFILMR